CQRTGCRYHLRDPATHRARKNLDECISNIFMSKILLIEDNPEVRENTAEILELAGYEVLAAPNGKAGVELAQKETPDLIICDIMMPELDGYGVLHILS